MKKNYQLVDVHQAEKILRFVNFVIDAAVTYVSVVVFFTFCVFVYSMLAGQDFITNAESFGDINPFLDRIITAVVFAFIMFCVELLTKGRSLGKFITGTKVVMTDGRVPTSEDFLKRNFSRVVPFDTLSFFGSIGWHDKWSDTRVVNWKKYQEALRRDLELDQLGSKEEISA